MDPLGMLIRLLAVCRQHRIVSAAVGTAAVYLLLARALRNQRRDKIIRDFGYPERSLASMTVDEAYEIRKQIANLEFPETVKTSLLFALFKTYAIPSISSLLLATGQLSSDATASKRAADTQVLMTEVTQSGLSSGRVLDSIARINYLHNRYRRAGKISDDDMLYTLSLFALEPSRWSRRMDWRGFSDVELCAEGVVWRDIGETLEIPYGALVPYLKGRGEDGLAWLTALEEWSMRYEAENAIPDETNRKVAVGTIDILLFDFPVVARGFFSGVISAVLDARTRKAMKLPEPSFLQSTFANTLFTARRLFVTHLSLPRPDFLAVERLDEERDPVTGKYHAHLYYAHPWYVKPTFSARWGPGALVTRMLGGAVPEEGPRYQSEGYEISEMGPEKWRGKGSEEMEETREWMRRRRGIGGCPMAL